MIFTAFEKNTSSFLGSVELRISTYSCTVSISILCFTVLLKKFLACLSDSTFWNNSFKADTSLFSPLDLSALILKNL